MKLKLGLSFILVVAGIYITNLLVSLSMKPSLQRDIIIALSDIVIGGVAAVFLSSYLTKSLKELTKKTAIISEGDLTGKVNIHTGDEIGELAGSFNKMLENLLKIIKQVRSTSRKVHDMAGTLSMTSEEINASTEDISTATEEIAGGAVKQAEMVNRTSDIMRDLAVSTEEISEKAQLASSYASRAHEHAKRGENFARLATDRIADATKSIERASRTVETFRERALEINKIVDFITSLSQHTHLLALNATIEASKAGEDGKGFAIVAEEIRKLADNVREFAAQISKIAKEINSESAEVVNVMETTVKAAIEGKNVVLSAGSSLDDIMKAAASTSDKMQEITILAEKQVKGTGSVVKVIEEIARIAEQNAHETKEASVAVEDQHAVMRQMSESAAHLAETSDQLEELIERFRIH